MSHNFYGILSAQLQDPGRPLWCERSMPMSENLHNINIFEVNYSAKTHNCQVAEDAIYLEGVSKWKQMGL